MVRRNHSVQYTFHPNYPWYVQSKETPKLYKTYYDLPANSWVKMKIVAKGRKALLYLDNTKEPVLIINGENDVFFSIDLVANCYISIPNADISIVPGCHHAVFLCNFEVVWSNIEKFLK